MNSDEVLKKQLQSKSVPREFAGDAALFNCGFRNLGHKLTQESETFAAKPRKPDILGQRPANRFGMMPMRLEERVN